jgi:hypothetical protein
MGKRKEFEKRDGTRFRCRAVVDRFGTTALLGGWLLCMSGGVGTRDTAEGAVHAERRASPDDERSSACS